jgi:hypothetical protein
MREFGIRRRETADHAPGCTSERSGQTSRPSRSYATPLRPPPAGPCRVMTDLEDQAMTVDHLTFQSTTAPDVLPAAQAAELPAVDERSISPKAWPSAPDPGTALDAFGSCTKRSARHRAMGTLAVTRSPAAVSVRLTSRELPERLTAWRGSALSPDPLRPYRRGAAEPWWGFR